MVRSRKRANQVLRSRPNSSMAANELAPERTPQTAMKTMLIRGCFRVRSTRGSLRFLKCSWKAAGSRTGIMADHQGRYLESP